MQRIPDLYKHMLAVSYQLEVALEVLAMAVALGRTPVLPKLWCWCDFDWYAVVLDGCAMGGRPGTSGADLFEMPFECPLDVLMDAAALYRRSGEYRQQRFLDHRRTPPALTRSREPVLVIDGGDEALIRERQRMVRGRSRDAGACAVYWLLFCRRGGSMCSSILPGSCRATFVHGCGTPSSSRMPCACNHGFRRLFLV